MKVAVDKGLVIDLQKDVPGKSGSMVHVVFECMDAVFDNVCGFHRIVDAYDRFVSLADAQVFFSLQPILEERSMEVGFVEDVLIFSLLVSLAYGSQFFIVLYPVDLFEALDPQWQLFSHEPRIPVESSEELLGHATDNGGGVSSQHEGQNDCLAEATEDFGGGLSRESTETTLLQHRSAIFICGALHLGVACSGPKDHRLPQGLRGMGDKGAEVDELLVVGSEDKHRCQRGLWHLNRTLTWSTWCSLQALAHRSLSAQVDGV